MQNQSPLPRQVIRPKEVCRRSGFSAATFWRRTKNDPNFPHLFPLGTGRAVGMFEDEFEAWLDYCANDNGRSL